MRTRYLTSTWIYWSRHIKTTIFNDDTDTTAYLQRDDDDSNDCDDIDDPDRVSRFDGKLKGGSQRLWEGE